MKKILKAAALLSFSLGMSHVKAVEKRDSSNVEYHHKIKALACLIWSVSTSSMKAVPQKFYEGSEMKQEGLELKNVRESLLGPQPYDDRTVGRSCSQNQHLKANPMWLSYAFEIADWTKNVVLNTVLLWIFEYVNYLQNNQNESFK